MRRVSIESVEFKNISFQHGDHRVLENCSFHFPMNKNCRIVFSNDSEKFHFFNSLIQLQGIVGEQFLINGKNIINMTFEEVLKYRLNIGFGFATRGMLHNKTLKQNLLLPAQYHKVAPEKEINDRVDELFDFFEIGNERNNRPSEVTTSQMKATLILRAFVLNPDWVILDAPEVLLSNRLTANLLELVSRQRKEGKLKHFYFSTQDESLAECLAEQTILLKRKNLQLVKTESDKSLNIRSIA